MTPNNIIKVDTKRIEFLDIAKGIGIILIVWYHIGNSPGHLLNLFFIPLFILISGIFFNPNRSPREFFRRKSNQLLSPMIVGIVLGIVCEIFIYDFTHVKMSVESGFYNFWLVGNVPLWFLLSLFWLMTIFYLLENGISNELLKVAIYVVLSLAGYWLSSHGYVNTFFIGHSLILIPFFYLGYKFKEFWKDGRWYRWYIIVASLVLLCVIMYSDLVYTNIHRFYVAPYFLPSIVAAICLIFITLAISMFISNKFNAKFLNWIGASTIFIIALHDLFVPPIENFDLGLIGVENEFLRSSVKFSIAIGLSVIAIYMGKCIKKVFPCSFP